MLYPLFRVSLREIPLYVYNLQLFFSECTYRIAGNFDGGKFRRLLNLQIFDGKILTDGHCQKHLTDRRAQVLKNGVFV